LSSIPYENLELHYQLPDTDPICSVRLPGLFNKLVTKKRGGYCMEQNFMLGLGLEAIGFKVEKYLARMVDPNYDFTVIENDKIISTEQLSLFLNQTWPTHIGLVVTIQEKRYLVDVGFAKNSFSSALEFCDESQGTRIMGKKSRLRHVKENQYFIQLYTPGRGWADQCYFVDEPVTTETEDKTHLWMSKGPHSVDPTIPFVTMPVKGVGQVSILERQVTIRSAQQMEGWAFVTGSGGETIIESFEAKETELDDLMFRYFGIDKEYRAPPRFRAEVKPPQW
jgi:N-hydroxyarylamine O-acetyltransferase